MSGICYVVNDIVGHVIELNNTLKLYLSVGSNVVELAIVCLIDSRSALKNTVCIELLVCCIEVIVNGYAVTRNVNYSVCKSGIYVIVRNVKSGLGCILSENAVCICIVPNLTHLEETGLCDTVYVVLHSIICSYVCNDAVSDSCNVGGCVYVIGLAVYGLLSGKESAAVIGNVGYLTDHEESGLSYTIDVVLCLSVGRVNIDIAGTLGCKEGSGITVVGLAVYSLLSGKENTGCSIGNVLSVSGETELEYAVDEVLLSSAEGVARYVLLNVVNSVKESLAYAVVIKLVPDSVNNLNAGLKSMSYSISVGGSDCSDSSVPATLKVAVYDTVENGYVGVVCAVSENSEVSELNGAGPIGLTEAPTAGCVLDSTDMGLVVIKRRLLKRILNGSPLCVSKCISAVFESIVLGYVLPESDVILSVSCGVVKSTAGVRIALGSGDGYVGNIGAVLVLYKEVASDLCNVNVLVVGHISNRVIVGELLGGNVKSTGYTLYGIESYVLTDNCTEVELGGSLSLSRGVKIYEHIIVGRKVNIRFKVTLTVGKSVSEYVLVMYDLSVCAVACNVIVCSESYLCKICIGKNVAFNEGVNTDDSSVSGTLELNVLIGKLYGLACAYGSVICLNAVVVTCNLVDALGGNELTVLEELAIVYAAGDDLTCISVEVVVYTLNGNDLLVCEVAVGLSVVDGVVDV